MLLVVFVLLSLPSVVNTAVLDDVPEGDVEEEGDVIVVDIIAADAVCCNCSVVNSIRGHKGFNMICCAFDC